MLQAAEPSSGSLAPLLYGTCREFSWKPHKILLSLALVRAAGPRSIPEATAHSAGTHTAAPTPNPLPGPSPQVADPRVPATLRTPGDGGTRLQRGLCPQPCPAGAGTTQRLCPLTPAGQVEASNRAHHITLPPAPTAPPICKPMGTHCPRLPHSRVWQLPQGFAPSDAYPSCRAPAQHSDGSTIYISINMVYSTATAACQLF